MYIVYKTTNIINGNYYIGVHRTDDEDASNYLGSGKVLIQAVEKYGRENFTRETLFSYEFAEDAFAKEAEILTDELLSLDECYNLKRGGYGGWRFVHENGLTNKNKDREHYVKMAKRRHELLGDDPEFKKRWLSSLKREPRSEETKQKISLSLSGRKRNRFWITNGKENKFHDATIPIEEGFWKGRT